MNGMSLSVSFKNTITFKILTVYKYYWLGKHILIICLLKIIESICFFFCNFRVIVLDKGLLVEFDTPENLLTSKSSIFYGMAKDAGLVWYLIVDVCNITFLYYQMFSASTKRFMYLFYFVTYYLRRNIHKYCMHIVMP